MRVTVRRTSCAARTRTRRRAALGAATVLAATLALAGCSGSDDQPDGAATTSSASAEPEGVATQVSFGKVAGRLPRAQREKVATDVGSVIDGWLDAAYVGGDYPRTDFADAWPGFTAGAQADARRDRDLMSNQDIGAEVDGVDVVGRALRIDVLAPKGKPAGVTAHVTLRFDTSGETSERVRVAGRLFLARGDQGWQVFGYDVTKGVV